MASSYGRKMVGPGDEVLLTYAEHHSNIVPWQLLREQTGCVLKVVPVEDDGSMKLADFDGMITEKTKIVASSATSQTFSARCFPGQGDYRDCP